RLPLLEGPHHLAEGDRRRRPGQAEAAASPAPGRDEAGLRQVAHDLGQVIARNGELAGDLVGGEALLRLRGEAHQGPQAEIREGGETHWDPLRNSVAALNGYCKCKIVQLKRYCKYLLGPD